MAHAEVVALHDQHDLVQLNLTLVTLNVWNNPDGRATEREPLILEQLEALTPDVVCLQEVDLDPSQVRRWADHLGLGATHLPNPRAAGGIKSLAVLWRDTPDDVDHLDLPRDDKALRLSFGGYDVITTHFLFAPNAEGSGARVEQAEVLLGWLPDVPPTIVAGDLNSSPDGRALAVLGRRLRSAGRVEWTHPTPMITHPRALEMRAQIDHVLVSPGIEVDEFRTACATPRGELWPSDHLGLLARLRF